MRLCVIFVSQPYWFTFSVFCDEINYTYFYTFYESDIIKGGGDTQRPRQPYYAVVRGLYEH